MRKHHPLLLTLIFLASVQALAQSGGDRTIAGALITSKNEAVVGAMVTVRSVTGEQTTKSDSEGNFKLTVLREAVTLLITGKNIATVEKTIAPDERSENLRIEI